MQNYLRKAGKKLVEDPDHEAPAEGEQQNAPLPGAAKQADRSKNSGGSVHNAPAHTKKGTRKKI